MFLTVRQLEQKTKVNGNPTLNSNIIIKTEQTHSVPSTPNYQLNDNSDDNEFKFELNDSLYGQNNLIHSNNVTSGSQNNVLKANNVLILTKPSANGGPGQTTTSKKFKTIVNTKANLLNNTNFL